MIVLLYYTFNWRDAPLIEGLNGNGTNAKSRILFYQSLTTFILNTLVCRDEAGF